MDHHQDLVLPDQALEQIRQAARDVAVDQFGVRQVELYDNADGRAHCLLEGPDEHGVRDHHAALDLSCRDAHRVDQLL